MFLNSNSRYKKVHRLVASHYIFLEGRHTHGSYSGAYIISGFSMEQNFDAFICVFQNDLKMSQIDSSRDFGYVSILNRQKQRGIEYFTTKLS